MTRNTALVDGGGLRLSYGTEAVMVACAVSFNTGGLLHSTSFERRNSRFVARR